MYLSLTSWSLPRCTLQEAAGISQVLGIGALDVGLFYRPALSRDAILADPAGQAAMIAGLGVRVPNYYHLFGDGLEGRNLALSGTLDANLADLKKVLTFCDAANIATLFVLPGVVNPGQSRHDAFAASVDSLAAMVALARDHDATLTIEPHVHSLLESPSDVLRMIERVEGLKLTLDYAHFVCLGYRQEEIDPLAEHAAHVHLRQARPGELQAKGHQGTINMPALFGRLRDVGYQGAASLEYVHQDYMNTLFDDVLSETIALRDVYRNWVGENAEEVR